MSDTDHISPLGERGGGEPLSEDKLMAYLEGKLPPEGQRAVELWLAEDGMESDALEGLRALSPTDAKGSVEKINYRLRKTIRERNKKRRSHSLNSGQVTLIAIVIVLLLAVLAYIVIRKSMQPQ